MTARMHQIIWCFPADGERPARSEVVFTGTPAQCRAFERRTNRERSKASEAEARAAEAAGDLAGAFWHFGQARDGADFAEDKRRKEAMQMECSRILRAIRAAQEVTS